MYKPETENTLLLQARIINEKILNKGYFKKRAIVAHNLIEKRASIAHNLIVRSIF